MRIQDLLNQTKNLILTALRNHVIQQGSDGIQLSCSIPVADPQIDTDYQSNLVSIDALYINEEGLLTGTGEYSDEEAQGADTDPVNIEELGCEEIAALAIEAGVDGPEVEPICFLPISKILPEEWVSNFGKHLGTEDDTHSLIRASSFYAQIKSMMEQTKPSTSTEIEENPILKSIKALKDTWVDLDH